MGASASLISGGQHLNLLTLPITTAQAAQVGNVIKLPSWADVLAVIANFTYGSGGTTVDAYIQTSLDGGQTWVDIMEFAFTTASAKKISAVQAYIAPTAQAFTPTDGTLTANTVVQGVIGDRLRVKYTTVGTYGGSTTLQVDVVCKAPVSLT